MAYNQYGTDPDGSYQNDPTNVERLCNYYKMRILISESTLKVPELQVLRMKKKQLSMAKTMS